MAGESRVQEYRPAPHVRQLVLNDAATRNALGLEMRAALVAALRAAADDGDCRVILLTGAGNSFASGSDIRMLAEATPADIGRPEVREIWDVLTWFPKPMVVAINGHALGGGLELALCGDVILAARGVKLGTPEPKLGIMPGGGATQRLARAVGVYRAMRLLLTAEPIDAETAAEWGIVSEICEPADSDGSRSACGRVDHDAAAALSCGHQGGRSRRVRFATRRRADFGEGSVPARLRERRQARGHGGVSRKAPTEIHRRMTKAIRIIGIAGTGTTGRDARTGATLAQSQLPQELASN